jgi:DNA-binding PucR family transcriptional regulator
LAKVVAARPLDTEAHLVDLVLTGEPLADLRQQVLEPLQDRPALIETLRAWLLHVGRRDAVAAQLFVHPQTVRYRMGQIREAYGDRLNDPEEVLQLVVALGRPD